MSINSRQYICVRFIDGQASFRMNAKVNLKCSAVLITKLISVYMYSCRISDTNVMCSKYNNGVKRHKLRELCHVTTKPRIDVYLKTNGITSSYERPVSQV